jgi:hypothetical protein
LRQNNIRANTISPPFYLLFSREHGFWFCKKHLLTLRFAAKRKVICTKTQGNMQQNAVCFAAKRSAKEQKASWHFITFNAPILIIRC